MRTWVAVLALAVHQASLLGRAGAAQDDESCPAGGGGGAACRPGGESSRGAGGAAARGPAVAAPAPGPQADLITQEVEELKALIDLSQERIRILGELQDALKSGKQLPLPETHARVLSEKVPLLSEVAAQTARAPVGTSDDYLISKAVIPSDAEVSFVKFMPLRSSRTPSSSSSAPAQAVMPTALLVAASTDGTVRLFTPSGELVLSFSAGHDQPVTQLAVSPSHEEYLLATSDSGGAIRVHKVSVRQRRLTKEERNARRNSTEEKVSQHLGTTANVTAQLHKQMQVPQDGDEAAQLTSLAIVSSGGSKYVLAGDAAGKINVFTRNGTLRGKVDTMAAPGTGVDTLSSSAGTVLFRSGPDWGYVEPEKLEARHVECHQFEGQLTSAVLDSQLSTRVLATDEHGTVWVFAVRNKRECKVEVRFAKGSTQAPVELGSVRGFAIALERSGQPRAPVSLVALNMSQAGRAPRAGGGTGGGGGSGGSAGKGPVPQEPIPPPPTAGVVWRRSRPPVRAWSVHRRTKEGDLIAVLSEDGKEIEILELLMQVFTPPSTDSFGNFKMPVIAVAIVLVLGYQYMKQKGKGAFGGGKGSGEDFASALRTKKRLAGLKGKRF